MSVCPAAPAEPATADIDPREFGLSADDLRQAADCLYDATDLRGGDHTPWAHERQVRFGQIRSRLRSLADAMDYEDDTVPVVVAGGGGTENASELEAFRDGYVAGAAAPKPDIRLPSPCGVPHCGILGPHEHTIYGGGGTENGDQ